MKNDHDADDRQGGVAGKARKAKQSTKAFAKANIHAKGALGKAARLAYTAQGVHGKGQASMKSPGAAGKLYQVG